MNAYQSGFRLFTVHFALFNRTTLIIEHDNEITIHIPYDPTNQ